MHENEATTHEAENEAEANNYEAENEAKAVKLTSLILVVVLLYVT